MPYRFVCDGTLGKLCKYLRMCGFDTAYTEANERALIIAIQQGRILLTRNTKLKTKEYVYFIDTDDPVTQLQGIARHLGLKVKTKFLSRCLRCNEKLKKVPKASVRKMVPFFTYKHFEEFARCADCGRVYWKGSHYQKMTEEINPVGKILAPTKKRTIAHDK